MPKELKPTVIVRETLKIPQNSKLSPGIYSRKSAKKCDQPSNGRKEVTRTTERKCPPCTLEGTSSSVYPKIMGKKEFQYFRDKAHVLTKEERDAIIDAAEKEKERLIRESMARKDELHRMDLKKRTAGSKLSEVETEARKRTMHLLERAFNLKLEQEEEIQKCNRLILETKCRAIRDAQIAEKKLIERELAAEEERLNAMMENERRLGMKEEERREREERAKHDQFAKILKDQIEENDAQRILEFERKQEESRLINLNNFAWQQDEMVRVRNKEAEHARIRRELAEGNEQLRHFKAMEKEENRIIDLRIQEFQRQKQQREAQMAEEARVDKMRKEREKQRIAAQAQQAQDLQATIDELNAARIQEEVEREWRRKEKEGALKRIEQQRRLKVSREEQINNKRVMQAMEIERDKREFERCIAVQKEALIRDTKEQERKQQKALQHRAQILQQVNEKEREKILVKEKVFEEGEAIRRENELRSNKLREAMRRKCQEMRDNNVPEMYVAEVERTIEKMK